MNPRSADGASQTENNAGGGAGIEDGFPPPRNQQGISRVRATLVETIARGKQDRLAVRRRVALSRVVSAFLVASTTASCVLLQRSGLVDLALGRMSVAIAGVLWFASTFTEAFWRDTRRACDGISLLCFVLWSFAHIVWRLASSEANSSASDSSGSDSVVVGGGDGTPAWVWVDMGVAWAIAPAAGGSLQLSLWGCIVPSWACVTLALAYGLRAEEVLLDGNDVDGALVLFLALTVCALVVLAVGYQVLWEQARDARTLMALEDRIALEDHKRRQTSFSELLLRHLVTEPSLQVLEAGVKELFKDPRIFVMHSDALEQIQDGVTLLTEYGDKALTGLKNGSSELPTPVLEQTDMEEILDACLRTTAYLAVSRDHHKVQLDLRVAADVEKHVRTYRLWLSQMTRACLIHALHPDENESVILRVSFVESGLMRVGIEAIWRAAATDARRGRGNGRGGSSGGGGVEGASLQTGEREREGPRILSGWDRDMPAAVWWVRAAALALGGEADYDRSKDREGFHELWFTIPAENIPEDELECPAPAAPDDSNRTGAGADGSPAPGAAPEGETSVTAVAEGEAGNDVRAVGAEVEQSASPATTGALPRPGAWAASSPLSQPPAAAPHDLPAVKKRGTLLPALRDNEAASSFPKGKQTTQTNVTLFSDEDRVQGGRESIGGAASGGGRKQRSKRRSSVSARHKIPPLENILVSRVATDAGSRHEGVPDGITRPSSAPGPNTGTAPAADLRGDSGVPGEASAGGGTASDGLAVGSLSRSAPSSPKGAGSKRSSLSITVRKLIGSKDGLESLRASLRGDEDEDNPGGATGTAAARAAVRALAGADGGGGRGRGAGVAMMMPEAVARAAGQGAAGAAAARLSIALRPSSAPSPATAATVTKKASVFGGLVQTLVESNSMNWLGTAKLGSGRMQVHESGSGESDDDTEDQEPELEILLVDPQGLVRWALPRLKERHLAVTVAHSAEEAIEMILEGFFQVAVVDLHMPGMSGTDFCRQVRAHELESTTGSHSAATGKYGSGAKGRERDRGAGAGGDEQSLSEKGDGEEFTPRLPSTKLLLHTTSAGSVRLDELEAFLEEGLVEQYVPHPLDLSTLFDFLKLFEEDDDQCGARKMSSLLVNPENNNGGPMADGIGKISVGLRRTWTARVNTTSGGGGGGGVARRGQPSGEVGFMARLFGVSRGPPTPSVEDVASTFFEVKGRSREAHAAAGSGGGRTSGAAGWHGRNAHTSFADDERPPRIDSSVRNTNRGESAGGAGGGTSSKTAGPWRPGVPAVSPGLGRAAEDEGRGGGGEDRGG